jgi:hypothetical protein
MHPEDSGVFGRAEGLVGVLFSHPQHSLSILRRERDIDVTE